MESEKTWQKNAASQIILDSIFAALAVVWITIAFQDEVHGAIKGFEAICSLLSFFILASSAEGTTTAYDEKDVLKFVYYLFWYNVGVVMIGIAIAVFIFVQFQKHFIDSVTSVLWCAPPVILWILVGMIYSVLFGFLLWRWIYDAWWLMCRNQEKFDEYLRELEDYEKPEFNRHWLMRHIFKRRIKHEIVAT